MTRTVSLDAVITASFLKTFQNGSQSRVSQPSTGFGGASKSNITSSLRTGAKTYSTALQNINYTINIAGQSKSALVKLKEITDKLIEIAEKALSTSISDQARVSLQKDFDKYALQFKEIVEEAGNGDWDYLTLEGLSDLLSTIGLDKDQSKSIAEALLPFMTADGEGIDSSGGDSSLAELPTVTVRNANRTIVPERLYGKIHIPGNPGTPGTPGNPPIPEVFTTAQLTNMAGETLVAANIAQSGEVTLANTTTPGSATYNMYNSGGGVGAETDNETTIVGFNKTSGYTVVRSHDDFLGQNPDGREQLYVMNPSGTVVHQITDPTLGLGASGGWADISADGHRVILNYQVALNDEDLSIIDIGVFGSGTGGTVTQLDSNYSWGHELNDAGTVATWRQFGIGRLKMWDEMSGVDTNTVTSTTSARFIGSDTVVYTDGTLDIYSYTYGSGSPQLLVAGGGVVGDAIENGYFLYDNTVADSSGNEVFTSIYSEQLIWDGSFPAVVAEENSGGWYDIKKDDGTATSVIDGLPLGYEYGPYRVTNSGDVQAVVYSTSPGVSTTELTAADGSPSVTATGSEILNLMATDPASGWSVIQSDKDLITGQNSGNYKQLFLVDNTGAVRHQLTTNNSTTISYASAVMAANLTDFAYVSQPSVGAGTAYKLHVGSYGTSAGGTATLLTSTQPANTLAISADGTYVASTVSWSWQRITIYNTVDWGESTPLTSAQSGLIRFGFIDATHLAIASDTQGTYGEGLDDVRLWDVSSEAWGDTLLTGTEISAFNTIEASGTDDGYLVYAKAGGAEQNDIIIADDTGAVLKTYDAAVTDTISAISLAHNGSGGVKVGVRGKLSGISPDSDIELYEINFTPEVPGGTLISPESFTITRVTSTPGGTGGEITAGGATSTGGIVLEHSEEGSGSPVHYVYTTSGGQGAQMNGNVTVCAYNESGGYSVVYSPDDPAGNGGFWITNSSGTYLHRLNIGSTTDKWDISANGLTLVTVDNDAVKKIELSSFGGSETITTLAWHNVDYVALNESGSMVAATSATWGGELWNGTTLETFTVPLSKVNFIGSNTVVTPGAAAFFTYTWGGSSGAFNDPSQWYWSPIGALESGYIGFRTGSGTMGIMDSSGVIQFTTSVGQNEKITYGPGGAALTYEDVNGDVHRYSIANGDEVIWTHGTNESLDGNYGVDASGNITGFLTETPSANQTDELIPFGSGTPTISQTTAGSPPLDVFAIDSDSGYTVIVSDQDLISGQNSGHYHQLFLVNAAGTAVHQLTANDSGLTTYQKAAVAADLRHFAYIDSYNQVHTVNVAGSYGAQAGVGDSTIGTAAAGSHLALSANGNLVAYRTQADSGNVYVYNVAAPGASQSFSAGTTLNNSRFGFVNADVVAVAQDTDSNVTLDTVKLRNLTTQAWTQTISTGGFDAFTTLEGTDGYFAFKDNASNDSIELYDDAGTLLRQYDLQAGDSITSLNLARSGTDDVAIGAVGVIQAPNSDNTRELYRGVFSPAVYGGDPGTPATPEINKRRFRSMGDLSNVLGGSVLNPVDAFKTLKALKELAEQLDTNIEAAQNLLEVLGDNAALVRATGLAMLDLADQIRGLETADDVARMLREKVRTDARGAVAQAENLDSLAMVSLFAN